MKQTEKDAVAKERKGKKKKRKYDTLEAKNNNNKMFQERGSNQLCHIMLR